MSVISTALSVSSLPQKLMLGGLSVALVAAAGYNVVQAVENRHLSKQVRTMDQRINDPKIGYVVRLTQAETNTATCSAAVTRQTEALRQRFAKDAATAAAVQTRYNREHAARLRAEQSVAAFLSRQPVGDTLVDRVQDVDARILGDLK